MFTLDPVRRLPSDDAETAVPSGHDTDRADDVPDPSLVVDDHKTDTDDGGIDGGGIDGGDFDGGGINDIRLSVGHDLDVADHAIQAGRIEDAHRALIHAQDVVFERHLEAIASQTLQWPTARTTDLFLRLTNRLIDANRFKDQAILDDCRSLLDLMADTYAIGRTVSGTTPS